MKYFLILLSIVAIAVIIGAVSKLSLKRVSRSPVDGAPPKSISEFSLHRVPEQSILVQEQVVYSSLAEASDQPFAILIVDDQAAIRMLLREMFELEGIFVYEAANGMSAIEQVRQNRIDFILLDVKMPDMDGFEALSQIRCFNSEVKVAMITAYGASDRMEQAKQLGTLAFFTKPFDIEIVKSFVLSHLHHT
ncbi:response regulator [Paenibacillus oenotherae]|uniref:Response regulator n=1 Tax=Paenibacillus oenotherae TaxID=1435645 RepID=A0ABS7DC87_9BACL|nr:response regulator [Paenibacillus oenotherae]MBW7477526.1 response regulator [Paenibacillus oenotherae]